MSDTGASTQSGSAEGFERRVYPRHQVRSLGYVELDEGNGGIILNASEGGIAVQAVTSLMDDVLPTVRFQLAQSRTWVKLRARVAWAGESRKTAGLEFVDLAEETRALIRDWLSIESGARPAVPLSADAVRARPATEAQPPIAAAPEVSEIPVTSAAPALFTFRPPPPPVAVEGPLEETISDFSQPAPSAPVPSPQAPSAAAFSQPTLSQPPLSEPGSARMGTDFLQASTSEPVVHRKTLYAIVAAAALIFASLAAGWAAGHGAFDGLLQKFSSSSQNGSADPSVLASGRGHIARLSQIEVVDASNGRWAIAFNGPISASSQIPRWQTSQHASAPAGPSQIPFQTWVLSAPVRANGGGAEPSSASAPSLPNLAGGADTSSGVGLGSGSPSSLTAPQPAPPPEAPAAELKPGNLIQRVEPIYPAVAREHGVTGVVHLRLTVGPDGLVRGVELISGPQVLVDAARTAVLQWRYSPTVLDGRAIETEKEISLVFQATPR
jgi:protein TonB